MEHTIGQTSLRIVRGDITKQEVDAVVNAANTSLLGGGGVDGAIHRAGGPEVLAACREIKNAQGGCAVGQAVITAAGNLPAKKIIHTVGPVWQNGTYSENIHLEMCYANSLALAVESGLRSVAFPSISTGAYKFPIERASCVALNTIAGYLRDHREVLDEVRVVLFTDDDLEKYRPAFAEIERNFS